MTRTSSSDQGAHDKFFRFIFSRKEQAKDFLRGTLSAQLVERLDLDSLELLSPAFVDGKLKDQVSDLVFKCDYRGKKRSEVHISFILEHKSFVPRYPHLQLLGYMTRLWRRQISQQKRLFPIIPIMIYHGPVEWEQRDFATYLEGMDEELSSFFPEFSFYLLNIRNEAKEAIEARYFNRILKGSILLMKYIFDQYLEEHIDDIFGELAKVNDLELRNEIFRTFIKYLESKLNKENTGLMRKIEENVFQWTGEESEELKALYDHFAKIRLKKYLLLREEKGIEQGKEIGKEEGIEQGKEIGKEEGQIEGMQLVMTVSHYFREGKSITEIANLTQQSEARITEILKGIGHLVE